MDNAAVIYICSFFSSYFSQGQKKCAEVFLLLVCEWVGGVLRGEESRIEINAGESFFFFFGTCRAQQVSGVNFVLNHVYELKMYALQLVFL